jgi:hypothetical protein
VEGSVQGFSGSTPYVWWGNWPFLAIAVAMLFPLLGTPLPLRVWGGG